MRFVIPDLADPNSHPKAVRRAVAAKAQAVRQAFRDHNERIRPLLPPSLQRLQETNLHDARVRSLRVDAANQFLQIRFICEDTSVGCFFLDLDYRGIRLTHQEVILLCLIAHELYAEVYWDEIDISNGSESPLFQHRILWNTPIETGREAARGETSYLYCLQPEIELRFSSLDVEITPCSGEDETRSPAVIHVVRALDGIEGMESLEEAIR